MGLVGRKTLKRRLDIIEAIYIVFFEGTRTDFFAAG